MEHCAFTLRNGKWGEAGGALAAICAAKRLAPRQVRGNTRYREDFQRSLRELGVELAWPKPHIALSYNSHYAKVPGWYFGEAALRK
jgi:hypothetical protein